MQFPFLSKHNVFLCPFHFLNHEQSIPTKTLSQFTKTRTSSNWMLLCENFKKTERMKKSFARIGVSIWNSIPYTLLNLLVNTSSETKLNKYFLKLKSLRMTILKSLNCSVTLAIYLRLGKYNNYFSFIYSFILYFGCKFFSFNFLI